MNIFGNLKKTVQREGRRMLIDLLARNLIGDRDWRRIQGLVSEQQGRAIPSHQKWESVSDELCANKGHLRLSLRNLGIELAVRKIRELARQ